MADKSYEYIIAGGGMAGLSLAFYLNENEILRNRKTLVIDREQKNTNDHTWCFWENEESPFEEIVYRSWNKFWFHGTQSFSELLKLENYKYKMIRAIDFYEFIIPKLKRNSNIEFMQADISEIDDDRVKTDKGDFIADKFVFDSWTRKKYDNPDYQNLWQHFLGWVIETENDIFNEDEPTLFDFRIEQKNECRFVYIMPHSRNKALIEFTIFSDNFIERDQYEANLRTYISDILEVKNYKIDETEFGIIPMSDEPHNELPRPKIIRIGTTGGYVKASTGYSFQRTQRRLQKIVNRLERGITNERDLSVWKHYMDSVLLNVMQSKKHPIDDTFTNLFKYNSATEVLRFLDEDTTLAEDIKIMRTVPILPFSKAAIETIFRKLK